MARALKPCSTAGCPELIPHGESRCTQCSTRADKRRGTATERGYNTAGHRRFRRAILTRDPVCVECRQVPSTVADHYPTSRRDLIATGLDPNDPQHGRGICKRCHDRATAQHQPGGWNA